MADVGGAFVSSVWATRSSVVAGKSCESDASSPALISRWRGAFPIVECSFTGQGGSASADTRGEALVHVGILSSRAFAPILIGRVLSVARRSRQDDNAATKIEDGRQSEREKKGLGGEGYEKNNGGYSPPPLLSL